MTQLKWKNIENAKTDMDMEPVLYLTLDNDLGFGNIMFSEDEDEEEGEVWDDALSTFIISVTHYLPVKDLLKLDKQ